MKESADGIYWPDQICAAILTEEKFKKKKKGKFLRFQEEKIKVFFISVLISNLELDHHIWMKVRNGGILLLLYRSWLLPSIAWQNGREQTEDYPFHLAQWELRRCMLRYSGIWSDEYCASQNFWNRFLHCGLLIPMSSSTCQWKFSLTVIAINK